MSTGIRENPWKQDQHSIKKKFQMAQTMKGTIWTYETRHTTIKMESKKQFMTTENVFCFEESSNQHIFRIV